jgi:predicted 2-oxoglutarate/Fe(II)-dependent dioxygenase YbiX/peroxiredoxin
LALSPGDPAPIFEARTGGTAAFPFHTVAGRFVVLSFLGSLQVPAAAGVLRHVLARHRDWFDDKKACFFGVSIDPADEQGGLLNDQMPGVRFIRDFDSAVSRLYGAAGAATGGRTSYRPMTLVLDAMLRVCAAIPIRDNDRHDAMLDQAIAALSPVEDCQAPVLVLPRVFEPELCARLIALHRSQEGRASGVMEEVDDFTVETTDSRYKKRRDVMVSDPALQALLRERLGRRLVPAIQQSFQFQVSHLERYLLGCYDADDAGFFTAHRDNVTRGTAHRRLALTINLNEDYEGGELVFPEFGRRTWRAATGAAVVFSCSLMHEVLPVSRGQRFAFLPFMHDDAAERVRRQNHKYIVSGDAK